MKAQKLGLVLGINMVAACLMMQGCKATKPGGPVPPSRPNEPVITVKPGPRPGPRVVQTPSAAQVQPVVTSQPVEPAPAPQAQPSSVPTVRALPPAPAPKAPKTKSAAAPASAAAAPSAEYVVKPGDTLFLISKRTNYRQDAILAVNPSLNADPKRTLRVGQKIKLPGAVAAPAVAKASASEAKPAAKDKDGKVLPAAAPAPAAANTKAPVKTKSGFVPYEGPTKEYVVKAGDSLGKIASESGISIRALKALNGLKQDKLRLNQKLKIPAEKQTAAKAAPAAKSAEKDAAAKPAVAAKDDAAKKAPAEMEAAAPAPAAAKPAEAAAEKPAEAAKADEVKSEAPATSAEAAPAAPTHVVKEGEDLVSIAIAYGISPSALMDINDLKANDEVKAGQVLKLPANAKASAQ